MLWAIGLTALVTSLTLVLLQNFKTPEKVLEHKVEHRYAMHDPQFRREMSVLLGPQIVQGNQVTALQNGDEIFPAMLLAIGSAQTSITFETYIYWSGQIGEAFSRALSERARGSACQRHYRLGRQHQDGQSAAGFSASRRCSAASI